MWAGLNTPPSEELGSAPSGRLEVDPALKRRAIQLSPFQGGPLRIVLAGAEMCISGLARASDQRFPGSRRVGTL